MRVPLAPLLVANRAALDALLHNESHSSVSAYARYKRMQTTAPPICLAADGLTVLDGLHRLQIAAEQGKTEIEVTP